MTQNQPEIDTAKLRRLMRERTLAYEHSRALTDRFIEIRQEIGRYSAAINAAGRRVDKETRELELAHLASLEEERDQIQSDREQASDSLHRYNCVRRLVDHATSLGFVVDRERCTVRRRRIGEPMRVSV